jgi:heterodisulfide reductase subunit B2
VSYVFFPGCSLEGTAKDYLRSTMSVARKLGLELPELKDWICCGSTAAHSTNSVLADALPAKNLSSAGGKTVAVACAACYSRLKTANHRIANNPILRARISEAVGSDYDGQTPVAHLLEILSRDIGRQRIAAAISRPLTGLKVACYYGCLLSRPPEVAAFDDPENPQIMDQLMEICGAVPVDWPHKTECCGASFSITDTGIVLQLTHEILSMAKESGVDCIVTACPLCQMNLDLRQKDVEAKFGRRYNLPVFYFTQLLGLAMGCSKNDVALGSLVVDPQPVLSTRHIAV